MAAAMVKMADGQLRIVRAERANDGDTVFVIPAGAAMVYFTVSGVRVRAAVAADREVTIHAP